MIDPTTQGNIEAATRFLGRIAASLDAIRPGPIDIGNTAGAGVDTSHHQSPTTMDDERARLYRRTSSIQAELQEIVHSSAVRSCPGRAAAALARANTDLFEAIHIIETGAD